MNNMSDYPSEKSYLVEVEELPAPATARPNKRSSTFCGRLFKAGFVVLLCFFIVGLFHHAPTYGRISKGCHGMKKQLVAFDGPQHPLPPIDDWKPFEGTTHFEFEPVNASGITIKGSQVFGKVEFTTSKFSNKVIIDLDIKTNHTDKHHEVVVKEKNGHLTIDTPNSGSLETHTAVKIQIPSNIFGTFQVPRFEVDAPRHMVDFSDLPESLEIGHLEIRLAKGFVKSGPVHTNTSSISVASGAIRGSLTQARYSSEINVASGNVTLDIPSIASGNEGRSYIHLGNGDLKGNFAVYNATVIDVLKGSIYIDVDIKDSPARAELKTKIASGDSRVYVHSIAAERIFRAQHISVAGDQLITYPADFQGTIDARGIAGDINLRGEGLDVEEVLGGAVGKKGDSERNFINVKSAKGALDILVGDE